MQTIVGFSTYSALSTMLYAHTRIVMSTGGAEPLCLTVWDDNPEDPAVSSVNGKFYANQLASEVTSGVQTDYSYDDNGNLVQKQTGADLTTYGFDSLDRMTNATVNGVTSLYSYDVSGKSVLFTSI